MSLHFLSFFVKNTATSTLSICKIISGCLIEPQGRKSGRNNPLPQQSKQEKVGGEGPQLFQFYSLWDGSAWTTKINDFSPEALTQATSNAVRRAGGRLCFVLIRHCWCMQCPMYCIYVQDKSETAQSQPPARVFRKLRFERS